MTNTTTTNRLTQAALKYLELKGHYVFRNNNIRVPGRKFNGKKGSADILGCDKKGRALAVEIKTGKDVQSEDQKKFQEDIQKRGGIYVICRKIEDLQEAGL